MLSSVWATYKNEKDTSGSLIAIVQKVLEWRICGETGYHLCHRQFFNFSPLFIQCELENKVYNVRNVTTGEQVVEHAAELDGISEGPYFDGLRLIIKDYDPAAIDYSNSGWRIGTSTLDVSIYLPVINMGSFILRGYAHPADYEITANDFSKSMKLLLLN